MSLAMRVKKNKIPVAIASPFALSIHQLVLEEVLDSLLRIKNANSTNWPTAISPVSINKLTGQSIKTVS